MAETRRGGKEQGVIADGPPDDDDDDENPTIMPRKQRARFPWLVLLVSYIIALIVVHKYGLLSSTSVGDETSKDATCEADQKRKRPLRDALAQIFKRANVVEVALESRAKSETRIFVDTVKQKDTSKQKKKKKTKHKFYFENAHSTEPSLSSEQLEILREFSHRALTNITHLQHRAAHVGYGGSTSHHHAWWPHHSRTSELDKIEGGRLLWSYYKIMSHGHMQDSKDLSENVHFPFKFCKGKGCSAEEAIAHTLEWRESYQPWRITPALLKENENGWVYTRGFSPPAPGSTGRHAMLYIRPGQHRVKDPLSYFRAILHSADRAIGEALHDSHGRVGKYNVLIDASDYEWSKLPDLSHFKQTTTMLQDHYPDRLGMLYLANMSRAAEFVVTLIKPLITKDVREKIHILSHDPDRRAAELEAFIEKDSIPDFLGGHDEYVFNVNTYYPKRHHWSDKEAKAFMASPYYAISS